VVERRREGGRRGLQDRIRPAHLAHVAFQLDQASPSLLVSAGRSPSSTSAGLTQIRRVSVMIPSCSPTRQQAPVPVIES
jgi:hypothetical protein